MSDQELLNVMQLNESKTPSPSSCSSYSYSSTSSLCSSSTTSPTSVPDSSSDNLQSNTIKTCRFQDCQSTCESEMDFCKSHQMQSCVVSHCPAIQRHKYCTEHSCKASPSCDLAATYSDGKCNTHTLALASKKLVAKCQSIEESCSKPVWSGHTTCHDHSCKYSKGCQITVSKYQHYCVTHTCADSKWCRRQVKEGSTYCDQHSCPEMDCTTNVRSSRLCDVHRCKSCEKKAEPGKKGWCTSHAELCKYFGSLITRCGKPIGSDSDQYNLCIKHRCSVVDCKQPLRGESDNYCVEHTCTTCDEEKALDTMYCVNCTCIEQGYSSKMELELTRLCIPHADTRLHSMLTNASDVTNEFHSTM